MELAGRGRRTGLHLIGRIGSELTGIDVVLDSGTTVQTMTGAGWWTTWLPGHQGGEVDTFTVAVHTAAGTNNSPPATTARRQVTCGGAARSGGTTTDR